LRHAIQEDYGELRTLKRSDHVAMLIICVSATCAVIFRQAALFPLQHRRAAGSFHANRNAVSA